MIVIIGAFFSKALSFGASKSVTQNTRFWHWFNNAP